MRKTPPGPGSSGAASCCGSDWRRWDITIKEGPCDELLRRALIEAVREDWADVLEEAEAGPPPELSPRYCRRRLKMLDQPFAYYKRTTRSAWRKLLRAAACVLLTASLAFGALMAASPSARAWVQEVLTQWLETHTWFIFTANPNAGTETGEWKTGYLPEGFRLESERPMSVMTKVTYINDEGTKIYLTYMPATSGAIVGTDNEHQGYREILVNGSTAYLLEASKSGERSTLIWRGEENTVAFSLMSSIEVNELVRIADSIRHEE